MVFSLPRKVSEVLVFKYFLAFYSLIDTSLKMRFENTLTWNRGVNNCVYATSYNPVQSLCNPCNLCGTRNLKLDDGLHRLPLYIFRVPRLFSHRFSEN